MCIDICRLGPRNEPVDTCPVGHNWMPLEKCHELKYDRDIYTERMAVGMSTDLSIWPLSRKNVRSGSVTNIAKLIGQGDKLFAFQCILHRTNLSTDYVGKV